VRRIASESGHVAGEHCAIVASPDGAHAAIVEDGRVVVIELAQATVVAEIGVATTPELTDVAWTGARLLVVSRRTTHSTVHLIDLDGPRARAEIQIEGMMRLGATLGPHALVIGATSSAVLTAGEAHLTPYQFPSRAVPTAAGAAGQVFVVAIAGAIEEWDPVQRAPRKRLRLPRPAAIAQVGGTERVVWLTTQQDPARIDVIAQVNRSQPKFHELPEPIARVSGHPQRDQLACLGRDGGVFVVELEGRAPIRRVDLAELERADAIALFAGPTPGVVVARAGQPIALFSLEARAGVVAVAAPSLASIPVPAPDDDDEEPAKPSSLIDPPSKPTSRVGMFAPPTDGNGARAGLASLQLRGIARGERRATIDPGDGARGTGRDDASRARPDDAVRARGDEPSRRTEAPRSGLDRLRDSGSADSNGHGARAANARTAALRGQEARQPASPNDPKRLRRLDSTPPAPEPERRGKTRELVDAPPPPPVVRPPIDVAVAALAPRANPTRCTAEQYETLLDHYRRFASTTALRAIAQDWDSGRLAFSTHDRPPFEAEVLGIVGRRAGLAAARVVEANEALEESTAALHAVRSQLGDRLSPLDVVCTEHGVDRMGEIVLLFVAAPALWGELARLYGILSNDSGRATCDEHLLWQLLGHAIGRREIARVLDPDGPLLHHGLIRVSDRGRPFQSLTADPIVVKLLSGALVDGDFEHGLARVEATVALDDLMIPAPVIDRVLADLAAAPRGMARLVVTGRSGSGRRTMLASLAQLAGRTLATIDGAMLIREKRIGALAGLLQHADLRGWLPCVDGLETIASDDSATRGTIREVLRDHVGPLAVRLPRHTQPPLEPGYVVVELPTSSISERAGQWNAILAEAGLEVDDVDELSARFTVGPGTIRNVVAGVARGNPPDPDAAIENALRQYLETKLGAVATRVTRLASWSQIVLPADIHDSIVELVARIRHRRTVYDTWGFDQVMSTSRGLTALFQGGPGTGKTLVASAIANELGLDLYRIDLSRVMSKWIGETEQNLAKVFDAAEEGQALILFDEADSLFGKRTEVRTSVDRYANLETNYLLQRLDSFEGVAVLTTNFGTAIDAAFKRRLSCRLTFPFPDDEARERLWRVHLPEQMPIAGALDLADLARRYKMSGGYIRNAALRAAFLAAEEDSPLSQDHLERAVRAEFREGGKLAESGFLE
jgi:hypothetical protein